MRNAVVLNNHTLADPLPNKPYPTNFVFQYDDDRDVLAGTIVTDGPGSLNDFKWKPAMGVWQLDMVDSALSFTGIVQNVSVRVESMKDLGLLGSAGVELHLEPYISNDTDITGEFLDMEDLFIKVPVNVTNMVIRVWDMTSGGELDLFVMKDRPPYDLANGRTTRAVSYTHLTLPTKA